MISYSSHAFKRSVFFAICILQSFFSYCQDTVKTHKINREFGLKYDNDIVFFSDKYYTSGLDITYARILKPSSTLTRLFSSSQRDTSKSIVRFNYGHKIYTPEKIMEMELENRDRPYAGWHYFSLGVNTFPKASRSNQFSMELGVVGKASGIGNFQTWYHSVTGIVAPEGWESQIANEFIVNLRYNRFQSFHIGKVMDFILETEIQGGNGQSFLGAMGTVRFGRINDINNSAYTSSRLDTAIPTASLQEYTDNEEGYLFYGMKGQYILNNIFIEGSLFNDNSPHQEELENFLVTQQIGYMYSNYYTTVTVTVYALSEEVVGGKRHAFASIALMLRF